MTKQPIPLECKIIQTKTNLKMMSTFIESQLVYSFEEIFIFFNETITNNTLTTQKLSLGAHSFDETHLDDNFASSLSS